MLFLFHKLNIKSIDNDSVIRNPVVDVSDEAVEKKIKMHQASSSSIQEMVWCDGEKVTKTRFYSLKESVKETGVITSCWSTRI